MLKVSCKVEQCFDRVRLWRATERAATTFDRPSHKRCEHEPQRDELRNSAATTRKPQAGEWVAKSEVDPVKNNLAILDHLAALEKSSGKRGAFQEGPRGPCGPLVKTCGGGELDGGARRTGIKSVQNGWGRGSRRTEIKIKSKIKNWETGDHLWRSAHNQWPGQRLVAEQEKIEIAICVAMLAEMAMFRKNQGMLDGKVAKGMWQSWEMIELKITLQITRRREISARKGIEKCKLQNKKCKLVDGSSIG
jgi:hypothetical protein